LGFIRAKELIIIIGEVGAYAAYVAVVAYVAGGGRCDVGGRVREGKAVDFMPTLLIGSG